ncbi:MAG: hypothetical protein IJE46_03255 [Clostridia bacterium]|nr:hypothetical protein [Clostridia bacterium]
MSQELKKMEVTLPQKLIDELKDIAEAVDCTINDIVEKSLKFYVRKCKKINIENLKKGYGEAAVFNLDYAEMCLCADNEALTVCEEKLSESE